MKKIKKKGFTLLELLAVIVILALIALIITPFVARAINEAKKGAFKNSAYGIVSSVELFQAKHLDDEEKENVTFVYYDHLEYNSANDEILPYKGEKPKSGIILLTTQGRVEMAISNGVYCAYKELGKSEITVTDEDCPDDILDKYTVDLALDSVAETTATVTASIGVEGAKYYFILNDGSQMANQTKTEGTFTFGELTPGSTHQVIAKAVTENGVFISEPIYFNTSGYTYSSETTDITNTTIRVRGSINPGTGIFYYKIGNGNWVTNNTNTYEFTGLTKNTSYTIKTKITNPSGDYYPPDITVKTKNITTSTTSIIQYKSAVYSACATGENTCVAGWNTYTDPCATTTGGTSSGGCYNYCPSCDSYAPGTCPWHLNGDTCTKNIVHCGYTSATECSLYSNHCTSLNTEDGLRYCVPNGSTTETPKTRCNNSGGSAGTCVPGTVYGSYSHCKTGHNTCQEGSTWDEDWGTVKPANESPVTCKKRVCNVSNGVIDEEDCKQCASCNSANDETCVNSLTPKVVVFANDTGWSKSTNNTPSDDTNAPDWVRLRSGSIYVHGKKDSRTYVYAYRNYDVTDYLCMIVSYSTNGYTGEGNWVVRYGVGSVEYNDVISSRGTIFRTDYKLNISSLSGVQQIKVGGRAQPEGGDVSYTVIKLTKDPCNKK